MTADTYSSKFFFQSSQKAVSDRICSQDFIPFTDFESTLKDNRHEWVDTRKTMDHLNCLDLAHQHEVSRASKGQNESTHFLIPFVAHNRCLGKIEIPSGTRLIDDKAHWQISISSLIRILTAIQFLSTTWIGFKKKLSMENLAFRMFVGVLALVGSYALNKEAAFRTTAYIQKLISLRFLGNEGYS